MPDLFFTPSTQPNLDCIIEILNPRRIDSITKMLITGGNILNDEIVTNVNPLILYLNLGMTFFNNEGANRILNFRDAAANIVYALPTVATAVSSTFQVTNVVFSYLTFSGVMVNAATTLFFNGYRINL